MRKLSKIDESTWGGILDKGAGETVRKEDDINYMSLDDFYDYVCSRYDGDERVRTISKETNPEYNKDIVIRPNKDMFVCGRYNGDDIKQIKIILINNGISVLKDFIIPNSPEEWKWKKLQTDCFELGLKNGEITNKTFIHLIDFLLGNKIDESIWGGILDRGRGETVRKEDMVKTNKELKEMIKNLYKEQGSGDTLDVTSIALGKKIICDDLSELFDGYIYIKRIIGLETWDVSNVINVSYMFYDCEDLTELNIDNWDVSNVTDMIYMFAYCKTLTELNIGSWDVSSVTNISYMFYACKDLTELNIDNWDVSNVTDMRYMFYYCNKLKKPKWYKE